MKKGIKDHWRDFAAIIALFVIALGVGGYILAHQRLRFPVIEKKQIHLKAEFSTAQAVTPGQGQTVRVSGVKVGDITKVTLKEGRAITTLSINPEYKDLIHTNATALLRPKTALKDMFIELQPGGAPAPVAKAGWTMPVANTLPDVNPDEILAALDGDTRDYLRLLINGAGQGLKGRGDELNELFKRFEPTHRDLERVTSKVSERSDNLRRVVHNLNRLNGELAKRDDDLAQLVDSAARTFRAFASQDTNISAAVGELPGALEQTTDTLRKVEDFANILGPSVERLRPAVRKLDEANDALKPLAEEATPIVRDEIRPFVRASRPLVRDLRPAARNLAKGTPDLTRTFVVLNNLFNMVGYNNNGREAPGTPKRDEGYLFWLGWLAHNGIALHSTAGSTGILRPVALQANCNTIKSTLAEEPETEFLQNFTAVLADSRLCGGPGNTLEEGLPELPPSIPLPVGRKGER